MVPRAPMINGLCNDYLLVTELCNEGRCAGTAKTGYPTSARWRFAGCLSARLRLSS
jgi:hypothetical protein